MLLQEDLVQMVPMISETNAMAEELDKKVSYSDKKLSFKCGRKSKTRFI